MVANGQQETHKSTLELKFEVRDLGFQEIFIVLENLTGPITGLMFLQRNHTVLDMRHGILSFRSFRCSSKQLSPIFQRLGANTQSGRNHHSVKRLSPDQQKLKNC